MGGFVTAERDRFKHHLFRNEKFCRGYAWDWIVANAAFRPTQIDVKGKTVNLKRGQLSYSVRYLAEAWNWDKAAVSRFIARLQSETMIETDTETGQLRITVCNYDRYQDRSGSPETATETATETPTETGARQERDRSETNKNNDNKIDDDDTREADQTHRERLLSEMGVDPVSGLTGPTGRRIGTRSDMTHVEKWAEAGVSEKDQIAIVRDVMARKRDGPPSSFGYFDRAMSDFAANKDRPLPASRKPSQQSSDDDDIARYKRLSGA